MKKKVLMLGAGLTLGSALVVGSAFAGVGQSQGYETYKDALKTTAAVTNATQTITMTLADNGSQVLSFQTMVKQDKSTENASGKAALTADGVTQTFDFYDQAGQHILKAADSDKYYLMTETGKHGKFKKEDFRQDPEAAKEMDNIVDSLVGNLKNQVLLSGETDGAQSVDVKLTGSQIPTAVNVIGSVLVKEALSGKHLEDGMDRSPLAHNPLGIDVQQIAAHLPKLTQDVNIQEIALHADIDENHYVNGQEIDFKITGKDAAGQAHEIMIRANVELSDLGSTTPETIDLNGKTVETVDAGNFDR